MSRYYECFSATCHSKRGMSFQVITTDEDEDYNLKHCPLCGADADTYLVMRRTKNEI